jgi:multiple sugar transport system substrate-binding protein
MSGIRTTRRHCLAVLSAGAGAVALAACGATPTAAPAQTDATAAPAAATVAATAPAQAGGEKKTLRFATYTFSSFEDTLKNVFFKAWEAQNPGVTIQGEFSGWDEYWTKIQTEVAAGSAPDVGIASCVYPVTYAKQGAVLPLDDLIARDNFKLDNFIPATVDLYRWQDGDFDAGAKGGKVYGLPGDAQGYIFVYNKTMFDAAGQDYPTDDWTWDDLTAAAKNLTKDADDKWGVYAPGFATMCLEGEWVYSTGGNIISSDYKSSALDSAETSSAFKWAWDLVYTDKVAPQPVPSEAANPFSSGRVAMSFEGVWALADFAAITDFEWDMAMHPKNPTTGKRTMTMQSDGWWMFKGTKEIDLAWSFLKYLVSDEGEKQFASVDYFIPPSIPSVAEEWYAKEPPANRMKAYDALMADSKKISATYFEGMSMMSTYMPELDKAIYDGAPIEDQLKSAAAIMNDELAKAWDKFKA